MKVCPDCHGNALDGWKRHISVLLALAVGMLVSPNPAAVGQQITWGITLSSSLSPSSIGQSVTFTATVWISTGTPTGTVAFLDGTTTLGTQTLTNGVASLSISTLSVGSHSITATYTGPPSSKGTPAVSLFTQVVTQAANKGSATVGLVSSLNPSLFGQSVTFTATVSAIPPATGTPTGTVTFLNGTATLATTTLSNGVAYSTSTLTVGSHSITAAYSGDTNFTSGTSNVLTQTVNQGATTIEISSTPNPSSPGQPIAFTVTVSAVATGTPTGTVTFLDGTTTLGTQPLVNGAAAFSTSTLSGGSHNITAAYSGAIDFTGATSTALTQIVQSAWLPADVSVGADDLARVLWTNPNGQAVVWSLDRTSGNYTAGPDFGPYDGGVWQATRIACGKDGVSHVLWNKSDGTLSLWWLNSDNTFQTNMIYGPFAGWAATDIAIGSDNLTRILWTNVNDGRAIVWSVDANGVASNNTNFYGPYPGYTAGALACGSDGLTRLIWANPLGIASYWIMTANNQMQSYTLFGPYTDWIPTDIDVDSDDLARVLWTNTVDGRAIVWSVDASGNPTNNQNFYGPFNGYTAQHLACGSDGFTRVTWVSTSGVLSFWHMASNNSMLTFNIYGPYY